MKNPSSRRKTYSKKCYSFNYEYLIRRVFKFYLEDFSGSISFKILKGTAGEIRDNEIVVNPRYDLLGTVIHEALHGIYPDWTEDKVSSAEEYIMDNLGIRHAQRLIHLLVDLIGLSYSSK